MTTTELLNLTIEQKCKGVFIEGDEINGELKQWDMNGDLIYHAKHKDGKAKVIYSFFESPEGRLFEAMKNDIVDIINKEIISDLRKLAKE